METHCFLGPRHFKKLEDSDFEIEFVYKLKTHSWGQKVVRLYDPDGNLIEAVLLSDDENWIGINQILSNRLVEFFFFEHELDAIVSDFDSVQREVNLGISKLDFKVGDTYLEVKTPLTTINVKYGKDIKTLPPKPFSSTDRMVKHLKELAGSLKDHEKVVFLQVYQYRITERKERLRSTHYEDVSQTFKDAAEAGVEFWEIQMDFRPEGVTLYSVTRSSDL